MQFSNKGFCVCCNQDTTFIANQSWLRDHYECSLCKSIPRERALMHVINLFYSHWRNAIIHESSPINRGASLLLRNECKNYIPSYYYLDVNMGTYYNGYRCENLENLSFENNSIDLHISQDVFEHIFDVKMAFSEIARTLKPGGMHIFTTPIVNKNKPSQLCAELTKEGKIIHYLDNPEYHGNPIAQQGSLVVMHWGYDITKWIHEASGLFTDVIHIDNLDLGIRAEYIEVLVTRKSIG